jgi:hypothetical protein
LLTTGRKVDGVKSFFLILSKLCLTVQIELPALIVEAVRDLVPDDPPDGAVVHVPRPIAGEENALKYSRGKLNRVLQRAIKRVDHGGLPVTYPVGFVDLRTFFFSFCNFKIRSICSSLKLKLVGVKCFKEAKIALIRITLINQGT